MSLDINKTIAVEVMGWELGNFEFGHNLPGGPFKAVAKDGDVYIQEIPYFDNNISDAWLIIERFIVLRKSYALYDEVELYSKPLTSYDRYQAARLIAECSLRAIKNI